MSLVFKDRVCETTTTTGTGTYALAGAKTGYIAFSAACSNSDTVYYCVTNGASFEVGLGTYTTSGATLARTTILATSAGDTNAVNWVAGVKDVFLTQPASIISNTVTTLGALSGRNRIINGDMKIDQRNVGASATPSATAYYHVDRWCILSTQGSKFTVGQNLGAVAPPAGFSSYFGCSVATPVTLGVGDYFSIMQIIEGYNISDLSWGTASAATVTLSFKVYSSLTGSFSGAVRNTAITRSYPFSFTIGSANTWTSISVTIPGDTTGTWNSTSTGGIQVLFDLGSAAAFRGTAAAWVGAGPHGVTGAVSVVETNGAVFYITGVQFEAGSVATPFEHRSHGRELLLCQRYFEKSYNQAQAPGTSDEICATWASVNDVDTTLVTLHQSYKATKRVAVTPVVYNTSTGGAGTFIYGASTATVSNICGGDAIIGRLYATTPMTAGVYVRFHWTADAEL